MLNLSTLNPPQRQAVESINGPVLILAGAGTGKTRVITYRIAHMVERGVLPGNILGVTFTNKAAREMQERVTKLLPKRKKTDDPAADRENRPTICTFHSLCVRILRQHIEKLGYKRNFVIYDESEQLSAMKKILSAFGVPSFVIDDQVFWGSDSLEFATAYLKDPDILSTPQMRRAEALPVGVSRAGPG